MSCHTNPVFLFPRSCCGRSRRPSHRGMWQRSGRPGTTARPPACPRRRAPAARRHAPPRGMWPLPRRPERRRHCEGCPGPAVPSGTLTCAAGPRPSPAEHPPAQHPAPLNTPAGAGSPPSWSAAAALQCPSAARRIHLCRGSAAWPAWPRGPPPVCAGGSWTECGSTALQHNPRGSRSQVWRIE